MTIKSAAAAGGLAMTVSSSGTNENLTIDAKGSGTVVINGTATGGLILGRSTTIKGNLTMNAVGNKFLIPVGTNAVIGTGTLAAGTVTISTTAVTANSLIFLTDTSGSTGQLSVGTKTAGTSFVVNSSLVTDTSTFNWFIIN
jgi:hypothetical protein